MSGLIDRLRVQVRHYTQQVSNPVTGVREWRTVADANDVARNAVLDEVVALLRSEEMRVQTAYLLWCAHEGYLLAEDRKGSSNWMVEPDEHLHPDDVRDRAGFLEMADTWLASLVGEDD